MLQLAKDFTPKITKVLGDLRSKYSTFKKLNMIKSILSNVRTLDSGVTELMNNLKHAIPVCNFPCHMKLCAVDSDTMYYQHQSQGVANSLQQQLGPAFQSTISLYS